MDPKIIAAIIGAIAGALGTLGALWMKRKWEVEDRIRDDLLSSLDSIERLTAEHIRKIGRVVSPLSRRDDFLETCERYHSFVHDPELPNGYGSALSVISGASSSGKFRGTPLQGALKAVMQQAYEFRRIGFLLEVSSWELADSMDRVRDLYKKLESAEPQAPAVIEKLAKEVAKDLQHAFEDLESASPPQRERAKITAKSIRSAEQLRGVVKDFFHDWQRLAEKQLYAEGGLHEAVGNLKFGLRGTRWHLF